MQRFENSSVEEHGKLKLRSDDLRSTRKRELYFENNVLENL